MMAREAEADLRVLLWRVLALAAVVALAVIEFGFRTSVLPAWLNHIFQIALLALYAADVWRRRDERHPLREARLRWDDWLLLSLSSIGALGNLLLLTLAAIWPGQGFSNAAYDFWWLFEAAVAFTLITELWRLNVALSRRFYRPGLLFPLSFLTLIAIGTPLLMIEMAVPDGAPTLSFIDALFTATSAVCVTGLIVVDTAKDLSPFGQTVIGVLIQLGGLGIIIFGSVLAMLLGARLSLRQNMTLSQMLNDQPLRRITAFVRFIVLSTLVIEFIGALLLMPLWNDPPGGPPLSFSQRFGVSLFHSVSAFCNAGFALQTESLVGYRHHVLVHTVLFGLIVIGGIGFPVLDNILRTITWRWRHRRKVRPDWRQDADKRLSEGRLSLHTKLVLATTVALYLFGLVAIGAPQIKRHFEPPHRAVAGDVFGSLADAHFMSITARTAGFNTMPMEELAPGSRFALMTLMMIGASPGGTGGGMKTITLAVLLLTVAATLRNRRYTEARGRQISDELVRKAATIAVSFLALIGIATLLLSISESGPFEVIMFEAVSAASTTGLSLGITPALTVFGKIVIILTMFLGRVGPLGLLASLMFGRRASLPYSYPREDVLMG